VAYIYGIDYERLRSGAPLQASIDIDGKVTDIEFRPSEDGSDLVQ
jgi:hypothetical protein